jgi:hypothetical protein
VPENLRGCRRISTRPLDARDIVTPAMATDAYRLRPSSGRSAEAGELRWV